MQLPNTEFNVTDLKIAIIQAKLNQNVTQALLDGALAGLSDAGLDSDAVSIFTVPGAFEISLAAKKAAQSAEFDVIICLGAIIKDETLLFDYVAQAVTAGVVQVNLETEIPVIFGMITAQNLDQAEASSKADKTNKGYLAALSAIEMVKTCQQIDEL